MSGREEPQNPGRRRFLGGALLAIAGLGGAADAADKKPRTSRDYALDIDSALAARPQIYPRELVEKCTAAALEEIKTCKDSPGVVKKLAALPNNTWLELNEPESRSTPRNHHSFPFQRGEGSATYDAATKGVVCLGGCGAPDYSCDLWVYKTGANRWFEVWPNIGRDHWKKLAEPPKDRPCPGCTLGLTFAAETGCLYRFSCANTGPDGGNVWQTRLLQGKWQIASQKGAGRLEGIRIAADPILHGLLAIYEGTTRLFSFKTGRWTAIPGQGPNPGICYALTYLPKHRCALLVAAPGGGRTFQKPQTWLFHSEAKRWELLPTSKGPEWYYRAGITYDSLNDVAILGGWRLGDKGEIPDATPGLWIFDPSKKDWHFEKPASGPKGRYEYFAYDPQYNVAVTAGNAHGTWVYRYKK